MGLSTLLLKRRSKPVWADPVRTVRTLESFAQTETDGGHDIHAAADQVTDANLKKHLLRHAEDELRHGLMFRQRAAALRAELGVARTTEAELERPFDLTRGHEEVEQDSHGFMRASLFDEMGVIAYLAMLHVAEKKATVLFRVHRDLTKDDPETNAIFEEILRDEKYHVAYTGSFLEDWRKAGKQKEVKAGLSMAQGSRFFSAWKRAGIRAAGTFGRVLLFLFYWTFLVPFALIARRERPKPGWLKPIRPPEDIEAKRAEALRQAFHQH